MGKQEITQHIIIHNMHMIHLVETTWWSQVVQYTTHLLIYSVWRKMFPYYCEYSIDV